MLSRLGCAVQDGRIIVVMTGSRLRSVDPSFPGGNRLLARLESKNPVEFLPGLYELHGRSKCEGHVVGQAAHHYLIFETAGGVCGIAWSNAGITHFQLPTKSAEATERMLLRQAPGAKPGTPTPEVAEAVAAVRRYFRRQGDRFFQVQARPRRAGPIL